MGNKLIKQPKKKYRTSLAMRSKIAKWEGSDFAGQNKQFGGDAILAKEKELNEALGDSAKHMDQDTYDAAMSYWYNTKRSSGKAMTNAWRKYASDPTEDNFNAFRDSFNAGYNWKGMSGLRKRRDHERSLVKPMSMLEPYKIENLEIPEYTLSQPVLTAIDNANLNLQTPIEVPYKSVLPIRTTHNVLPDLRSLIERLMFLPNLRFDDGKNNINTQDEYIDEIDSETSEITDTGVIVGLKKKLKEPDENDILDILPTYKNYVKSDLYKERASKTYCFNKGEEAAEAVLNTIINQDPQEENIQRGAYHNSSTNTAYIPIDYTADYGNMTRRSAAAHEISHGLHNSYKIYPEHVVKKMHIDNVNPKEYDSIYGDYWYDYSIKHDTLPMERAAMIHESRQLMKDAGIWDFTDGSKFTPEMWDAYRKKFPKSRIGNFYKDYLDDIIWLMNNLAYNNESLNSDIYYADKGKNINQPKFDKGWNVENGEFVKYGIDKRKKLQLPSLQNIIKNKFDLNYQINKQAENYISSLLMPYGNPTDHLFSNLFQPTWTVQ